MALGDHAIQAWTLQVAAYALALTLLAITLKRLTRLSRFVWKGFRAVWSKRRPRLDHEVENADLQYAASPFTPERNLPSWVVSASNEISAREVIIRPKLWATGHVFRIPVYVTNTSQRPSAEFSLSLYFRKGFAPVAVEPEGAVSVSRDKTRISRDSKEIWESVTFRVLTRKTAGICSQVGVITISPSINYRVKLEIPWDLEYDGGRRYPEDSHETLTVTLEPLPFGHSINRFWERLSVKFP
jgi:hypothetical protein